MHHVHVFDSNGGGNITRERAFAKQRTQPVLIKSLKKAMCAFLRAVTRATLIFLYRMVVTVIAIRVTEVTPSPSD